MVKIFTLLIFLFAPFAIQAQNINIPDANFKKALINDALINTNNDNHISISEAEEYNGALYLGDKSISDLTGIEHFINITMLQCQNNKITTLDLSKNLKLERLYCYDNFINKISFADNSILESIDCYNNNLKTLNVSNNHKLKLLHCYNNQIHNLILTGCTNLTDLDCNQNLLNKLNVDENSELNYLDFQYNSIENINLSNNPNILTLSCYNNKITNLDIKNNINLKELYCSDNLITNLNLSKNHLLTILDCSNCQISTIDISQNINLKTISITDTGLDSLNLENNTSLTELNCANNNLLELDVSHIKTLSKLNCYNNKLGRLKISSDNNINTLHCSQNNFPFSELQAIKELFPLFSYYPNEKIFYPLEENISFRLDYSKEYEINGKQTVFEWYEVILGKVSIENVKQLEPGIFQFLKAGTYYCLMTNKTFPDLILQTNNIRIKSVEKIVSIPDKNFKQILVNNSEINTNKDAEISINEAKQYTGDIWISERDIENVVGIEEFPNITSLTCSYNRISNLDISKNTKLTTLNCGDNPLSKIDLSKNTLLQELECFNTNIKDLNLSNNSKLKSLNCMGAELTQLNVSKNTELEKLFCEENDIETLIVSNNTKLTSLLCGNTKISTLDLSKNELLETLYCYNTKLEKLDISNNFNLKRLDCYNNKISHLDLSKNTSLNILYCSNNLLNKLDISKNTNLYDLKCNNNLFPFSELKKVKDYYTSLKYTSNKLVFKEQNEKYGFEIDYSIESEFNGTKTSFKWYNQENNEVSSGTIKEIRSGIFKFLQSGSFYCKMFNDFFNSTILQTSRINITKKEQTIEFLATPSSVKANDEIELQATASSGLEVTFEILSGDANINGNNITFNQTGTVEVKAIQAGNDEYEAAETTISFTVDIATGIDDIRTASVQIYPNPVVRELNINFEQRGNRMIYLYDLTGHIKFQKESHSSTEKINISKYSKGIYILKIQSENETITRKIVKQ
ncbi:hypothetical protein DF185_19550 [Marinifilum breve]|uniref:Secretion system C-terminal sorting domain-containing protein n=1 Tax=Marinifilum breve TaxID=2184082 RepID=A0A2V3ZSK4_9BACT|nr:T9SS type A sorting domain-containing protein [Marinifilum breve]PXX96838.1 hypothetical protein DF185_19550 [Marinifilum breve]